MKHMLLSIAAALALGGCSASPPDITVRDAWARATAPGQSSGAIYATIDNKGGADRLTGASATVGMAMLHANETSGGMARMRMVDAVDVPAGGTLTLAPGGTHVMLSGLTAPLVPGAPLRLTLRFAEAGPETVDVRIVAAGER